MSCTFKAIGSIVDLEKIWQCLNVSGKYLEDKDLTSMTNFVWQVFCMTAE